jgi:hypothetical protein
MTTLNSAKEALIQDINRVVGVDVKTYGPMERAISAFISFLEGKGAENVEDITKEMIGSYRLHVRIYADRDNEEGLVAAAGALLSACATRGWIDKDLCSFHSYIAPVDFFTNSLHKDVFN